MTDLHERVFRVPALATVGMELKCDICPERAKADWLLIRPFDLNVSSKRAINKLACASCADGYEVWDVPSAKAPREFRADFPYPILDNETPAQRIHRLAQNALAAERCDYAIVLYNIVQSAEKLMGGQFNGAT